MNPTADYPLLAGFVFVREIPLAEEDWHRILRRARPTPLLRVLTWALSVILLASFPVALLIPSIMVQAWGTVVMSLVLSVYVYLSYRDQQATAVHLGQPVLGNLEYRSDDGKQVIEFLAGPNLAWRVNGRVARYWTHLVPLARPTNPDRAESDYQWANGDIDRRVLTTAEQEELGVHLSFVRGGLGWYDAVIPFLFVIFLLVTIFVPFDDAGGRIIFAVIDALCLVRVLNAARIWQFAKLLREDFANGMVMTLVGALQDGSPVLVEYLPRTGILWRAGQNIASWRTPTG